MNVESEAPLLKDLFYGFTLGPPQCQSIELHRLLGIREQPHRCHWWGSWRKSHTLTDPIDQAIFGVAEKGPCWVGVKAKR